MSQEQGQVSKTEAAQRASRRRTRKTRDSGDPDSPWWQEAAPWYQGRNQDDQAGDEDSDGTG